MTYLHHIHHIHSKPDLLRPPRADAPIRLGPPAHPCSDRRPRTNGRARLGPSTEAAAPSEGRRWTKTRGEPMINLLLVDHPPAIRRTLRARLSLEPDIAVVGEADDAASAGGVAQELRP